MVGTFLPWMGAWILANQLTRGAPVSPVGAFGLVVACSVVLAIVAVMTHFPGAAWGVGTFGIAFLPGVALAPAITGLGARRA
jgi:hypothetical protein